MNPVQALKQYYGYDEFREGQAELIEALASGKDAMGVMPTGAGKSLCYQIPAILLPGVTLVVSPLISLMRDQVRALVANGISAAYINSSLTVAQLDRVTAKACAGEYKIIYVAPERLLSYSTTELAQTIRISMVAVDEAHCISQWGQDFRPSYLDVPKFVAQLRTRPVVTAFTATATPRVREDILRTLTLRDPLTVVTGFDRPNLYFEVRRPRNKYDALTRYLRENDGNGVVYCSTRKECETVAAKLVVDGFSAARYHAGLADEERSRSQDDFLFDRVRLIVATNAFGMGIDKSNVRFVVHYNMPKNVESYYQEAGRAGRDGLAADCILFYGRKDINTALFLINQSDNLDEIHRNRRLLDQMERYCETEGCLRSYMLAYFGEQSQGDCGNCGNCNGNYAETDVTVDAQKLLSHITRLNKAGYQLMFTYVADTITGKSMNFTSLPTHGIMKGSSRRYIRLLESRLTSLGYIHNDGHLSVTAKAREVLFGGAKVTLRTERKDGVTKKRKKKEAGKHAFSDDLFEKLKQLRITIAHEEKAPAFVVFSDATLVDMCRKRPNNEGELLEISGVGNVKLQRYGDRFLELLCAEDSDDAQEEETPKLTLSLLLQHFETSDELTSISRIADLLNAVFMRYNEPNISGKKLNDLLLAEGYLETIDGVKLPSDVGREYEIISIERENASGAYVQCLYGAAAQRVCAELAFEQYCSDKD